MTKTRIGSPQKAKGNSDKNPIRDIGEIVCLFVFEQFRVLSSFEGLRRNRYRAIVDSVLRFSYFRWAVRHLWRVFVGQWSVNGRESRCLEMEPSSLDPSCPAGRTAIGSDGSARLAAVPRFPASRRRRESAASADVLNTWTRSPPQHPDAIGGNRQSSGLSQSTSSYLNERAP